MATDLQNAFDEQFLLTCKGYKADFIGHGTSVTLDKIVQGPLKKMLPEVKNNPKHILHYTNLSVLYNKKRRVPFAAAYNIDGDEKATGIKRANTFKSDPRLDDGIQLSQKGFYDLDKKRTEFEIGHMAANNEMAWGPVAQLQSYMTFHFPNSVPQAENLNTGIWKTLESYIIREASVIEKNKKICVFTGPVLHDTDPKYVKDTSFQIPLLFYKVIVFKTSAGLFSTAFMMSHKQKMEEQNMFVKEPVVDEAVTDQLNIFKDFKYKEVFQVNIDFLEKHTGLHFSWNGITRVNVPNRQNQVKSIEGVKDSADADAIAKKLRKGEIPAHTPALEVLTEKIARKKKFGLNIILPAL